MGARTDLMEVAGALASEAWRLTHSPRAEGDEDFETVTKIAGMEFRSVTAQASELALGAKAALEAAALVDAEPAPIIAALGRLHGRLGMEPPDGADPAVMLDDVAEMLEHYGREVQIGAAVQHGYVELRELLTGLYRDFEAGDTETARRIATRIQTGLDDADAAITAAKGQEAQHG